ncbi:hypothetical protein M1770_06410 [Spiroplasma citri]|uniref:hypothetical protein n=1 Tax=Spiroplasma citri TaxID=2133 RepID=UPI0024126C8C|nr:hypothetical protein [Spiroplasma citri]WFG97688.1 hypothetical protein M1770_06410 [Spiroplasma citri]
MIKGVFKYEKINDDFSITNTFTSASITSVVSCTNVADIANKTNYHVIPNVASIKAAIQKLNYNPDNFAVDLDPGMKTATIRSMPYVSNQPFLAKKN